jgi:hypothetical protein
MSESSFAAAVVADEQLLCALAAGEDVAAGGLGELLSAWHAELAAATPASAALPALPRIAGRSRQPPHFA